MPDDPGASSPDRNAAKRCPAAFDAILYQGRPARVGHMYSPGLPKTSVSVTFTDGSETLHSVHHDPDFGWCFPEERTPSLDELPAFAEREGAYVPAAGDRVLIGPERVEGGASGPLSGVATGVRKLPGGKLAIEVEVPNPLAGRTLLSLLRSRATPPASLAGPPADAEPVPTAASETSPPMGGPSDGA